MSSPFTWPMTMTLRSSKRAKPPMIAWSSPKVRSPAMGMNSEKSPATSRSKRGRCGWRATRVRSQGERRA